MARPTFKDTFVSTLAKLGGRASNPSLLKALAWDEERYWRIHADLFAEGKIEKGQGYGGTVFLVAAVSPIKPIDSVGGKSGNEENAPLRESDLYGPITTELQKHWHQRQNLDTCHVENVAQQGARDTGGSWSRPDIALVALKTYEYLPDRTMEIHTFEVKPSYDVSVKGVMEALTHRQFATRSFVIFFTAGKPFGDFPEATRIEALAARHGVGVLAAANHSDFNAWEEIVPALRTTPDPDEMELFVKRSLSDQTRSKILKWLK